MQLSALGSKAEQFNETLQALAELLALPGPEFAHQRLFKLVPVIGKAIADARATLGEGNAGRQFRAHSLTCNQFTIEQAGEAKGQGDFGKAQFGGQGRFSRSRATELEENGVVARFEPTLNQRQQQRLMRKLSGLDEPVKRGTG